MTLYLTLKALHIIAMVCWMAGLLYLPRLFAYHADAVGDTAATFKTMERRLFKFIMTPAMIATWLFGGAIFTQMPGYAGEGWFQLKLFLVIAMTGVHGYYGRLLKDFAADRNRHTARFYKWINEIPTVLMFGIVFLVVFKGF